MLQTFEATIQPNLALKFSDPQPPAFDRPQRVLITVLQEPAANGSSLAMPQANWDAVFGSLKDSAAFSGNAVSIQKAMRDEWQ